MRLPELKSNVNKTRKYVIGFGGINKGDMAKEGELSDSLNMSSSKYPYLFQRGEREENSEAFASPTAIFTSNDTFVVDGTKLLRRKEDETDFSEIMTVTEGEKSIAKIGNVIMLSPDNVWYDTEKEIYQPLNITAELGPSARDKNVSSVLLHFTTIGHNYIMTQNVDNKANVNEEHFGDYATNIKNNFSVGDAISIETNLYVNNTEAKSVKIKKESIIIKRIEAYSSEITLWFDDNTFYDPDEYSADLLTSIGKHYIKKEAPQLSYLCECGGRIWGTEKNTIYGSGYMSANKWKIYEGLSSDSYAIDVGTTGDFTGSAPYSTHVCFFKENHIHKLYGNRPSNFNLVTVEAPGVQKGCEKSVVKINERIYYKARDGICVYAGGLPEYVCFDCFGGEKYSDAVGGTDGVKYYISMKNSKGEYELFVYDTRTGVLLKEDNTQFIETGLAGSEMLFLDAESKKIIKVKDEEVAADVEWCAELREFNETVNEKKGYFKLSLRYVLDDNAYMKVEIKTGEERFKEIKTVYAPGEHVLFIPIAPNRCDKFKIRLSGRGGCKIMNIIREFAVKGEV